MTWTWRFETLEGTAVEAPTLAGTSQAGQSPAPQPAHANQSDAESWLGERWRELADAGIAQVTLFEGDRKVYGPMALAES